MSTELEQFKSWFSTWQDSNIGSVELSVEMHAAACAWIARAALAQPAVTEMPEMPEGTEFIAGDNRHFKKIAGTVIGYTADQMHAYAEACVIAATTECSNHWRAALATQEKP